MNVKELKLFIKDLPDEMEVIMQKDSEGNGYSPLSGGDCNCVYVPDSTWDGEIYDTTWSAEDADMEDDEWTEMLKKERSLVLYPIN